MKPTYLSSLFSMHAQVISAIITAGKQKYDNINRRIRQVGIKFDNISAGKLYPEIIDLIIYIWPEADGTNEPSVLCRSTSL